MLQAAALAFGAPWFGRAQAATAEADWPQGPITIYTPNQAGGTSHNLTSVVAAQMSIQLKTEVLVQAQLNRTLAEVARLVLQAPPNGHTALLASNVFVRGAVLQPDIGYDPMRDFKPAGMIAGTELVLVALPRLGVDSLRRLIELARAREAPLRTASFGLDSISHLAAEQLQQAARINLHITHYRGQSPAVAALLAGQQELSFVNLPELMPLLRNKRVLPLAMAGRRRAPQLPEVPTLLELGYPITYAPWYGLALSAATPDAIVQAFNRALHEAVDSSYVDAILNALGATPRPGPPADMHEAMLAELQQVRRAPRAREEVSRKP